MNGTFSKNSSATSENDQSLNDSFLSDGCPKQMVEALWSPTDNNGETSLTQTKVSELIKSHSQRRLNLSTPVPGEGAASSTRGGKMGTGYRTGSSGGGLPRTSPRLDEKLEDAMRTISELEHEVQAKEEVIV